MTASRLSTRVFIAGASVLAVGIALRAAPPQRGGGAPAGPPLVPVTASSLAAHPATYVGQMVTMTATVERQLSATVFTVDQDRTKTLPADVLVIAPTLTTAPPANAYITVIGNAVLFDPADLGKLKDYTLDIAPDIAMKYRGRPAVFATSIITADLTDIAKKKPAPMTIEEEAFSKIMKSVGPTSTALRTAVTGSDAPAAHQRAAELKKLFTDAQAFFKLKNVADAQGWAGDAIKAVDAVDTAAAGGKWADAATSAAGLNQLCTTCHTAHRERLDDGTYRFKK